MKSIKLLWMAAYLFAATFCSFAQGKDWAQFGRYNAANQTVTKTSDAVFLGNSITDNWWKMDSTFFLTHNYLGRGISGQTSAEMLVRFRADVINLKPKAVVILAGTNDVAQNNGYISLENVLGNIISMTELAKAHNIRVLLCSVTPSYDFGWRHGLEPAQKIAKLNSMIKDYALKYKITYVDYYSKLVDERGGLPEKFSKDGVHPTIDGYKVMEDIIVKALKTKKQVPYQQTPGLSLQKMTRAFH